MNPPAVAFFTSTKLWLQLWGLYIRDAGGVNTLDVIAERATAFDYPWQVLVVDATAEIVEAGFVDEVHKRDRAVMAVWDPTDPAGKQQALDAGVDDFIEMGASPSEFVDRVTALAVQYPQAAPSAVRRTRRASATFGAAPRRAGQLVAVGGPIGASPEPVALGLAREVAGRKETTVLIDANELSPCVAQLLGLAPVPNIASAVSAARSGPADPLDHLQEGDGFWIMAGLAEPGQWAEISSLSVLALVSGMAARFDRSYVIVGPVAENLGHHGDRFGTTRAILAEADAIVAVGVADPVGLQRLTVWVADARAVAPSTPLYLAVGAAPGDRFRQGEVKRVLADLGGPAATFLLPGVDAKINRAAWQGRMPSGPLVREAADMAKTVSPKGRKR